jgi:hypothetical protein
MPKMHSKIPLETKNQVLQEVPKTIFMTPICVCSTTNTKGLQLFFKSMELYLPRGTPIYLASPSKPYLNPFPLQVDTKPLWHLWRGLQRLYEGGVLRWSPRSDYRQ